MKSAQPGWEAGSVNYKRNELTKNGQTIVSIGHQWPRLKWKDGAISSKAKRYVASEYEYQLWEN